MKFPSLILKTIFVFLITFLTYQLSVGQNVNNGGQIGNNQTIAPGAIPERIISISPASGGDSTTAIEYIWLQGNVINNLPGFTSAIGINDKEYYDPPSIDSLTFFIRSSRRSGYTEFIASSNVITITTDQTLSVPAIETSINQFYPNPVTDYLQIEFKENASLSWQVDVFDVKGSLQRSIQLEGVQNIQTINLQDLVIGTYLIQLTDLENNKIESFKILKE